jgi:Domain of unknown function (DUF4286)
MIIYNVTINVDDSVHSEWLNWMRDVHIPEVMATGYFLENRFCRILVQEQEGTSYSVQYLCKNMEDLQEYQRDHAPALQKAVQDKYAGKFVAFRTLLEVVRSKA